MLDLATISAIATSAVAVLTPILQKAVDKGAEEIGKSTVAGLLSKLKSRLTHEGAKLALADMVEQPADVAAQGALTMQLRKALAADPELATFLQQWSEECKSEVSIGQVTNVQGDRNKVTQVVGSGNKVT